ncbi:hypothetical protein [Pedobacter duraquae]|uniref:Uncharacterized protein n=1 Tax=Pedobacter duraquae TaxID=425511 RepID=A0A4R6IFU4_9SPHI|nr:hypothetical protein [Pedobacter duraquae]TDO20924.1 hypothetical protein CLV32_3560 [Pedobacter duraquae]
MSDKGGEMLKIFGVNFLLFIAYVALIVLNSANKDRGFNIAVGMAVCMCIQVVLNGIAGVVFLVIGKRELGRILLISAGALMPIGFVSWLILLRIFG